MSSASGGFAPGPPDLGLALGPHFFLALRFALAMQPRRLRRLRLTNMWTPTSKNPAMPLIISGVTTARRPRNTGRGWGQGQGLKWAPAQCWAKPKIT